MRKYLRKAFMGLAALTLLSLVVLVGMGASSQTFLGSVHVDIATIVNSTGTGTVTLSTAGSSGSRINYISVTNTDTSAYNLTLYLTRSSTNYLLWSGQVPASSGNSSTVTPYILLNPALWFALPQDGNGQPYLQLKSGDTLTVALGSTITSGKTMTFYAVGGDF
ncbi:MAG: hypothetical protein KGL39_34015 [Patescibacteria group bacterium]|nr:hypothetical protein [Patescibacteria group bacterium]